MTLTEIVRTVLDAAGRYTEKKEDRALPDALNAVVNFDSDERDEIRTRIAESLHEITSPTGVGLIAIWLGAAIENEGDPKVSGKFVISSIIDWSKQVPDLPEDDEQGDDSKLPKVDSDLVRGLEMLGQSAVAHLSRDDGLLTSLRCDEEAHKVLTVAENWSPGPMWVMEIVRQRSGEMIVLHGVEKKGFNVRYENLSNCFHLFTLLQGALGNKMPGGRKAAERALAVALGDEYEKVHDQAWWHFGQGTSASPELATMVFGEATLESIEKVDGVQVLLLWPPILESRSWDGGFFSPYLAAAPPSVRIVAELDNMEIEKWRKRLKLKDSRKRRWWKPFNKS